METWQGTFMIKRQPVKPSRSVTRASTRDSNLISQTKRYVKELASQRSIST